MTSNRAQAVEFFQDALGLDVSENEHAVDAASLVVPPPLEADFLFCLDVHREGGRIVARSCRVPSLEIWDAHALDSIGPEDFGRIVLSHFEEVLRHESTVRLRSRLLCVSSSLHVRAENGWRQTEGGFRALFNRELRKFARHESDLFSPAVI